MSHSDNKVYVYDPSANDKLSQVRGVGRYMQIMRENLPEWKFTSDLSKIEADSVFINPFLNFLQPPLMKDKIAKKQIAVIHDLIPLKYPLYFPKGVKGWLNVTRNKKVLKNYDTIVTDSKTSKRDIVQLLKVDEKKVKVIYPCLPQIFVKPKTSSAKQKNENASRFTLPTSPFCLYVGDVTWNKNLLNIAKAIKLADVQCVFVGQSFKKLIYAEHHPWHAEYRFFMHEALEDKRFIFPGFISDDQLISLYKNTQVNLLMSRDEGFGFPFLEAASQKNCTIVSQIPVLQEITSSCALYANPEDPQDIARIIKKVYSDSTLKDDIGNKAFLRSADFSSESFREGWVKTLA